VVNSGFVDKLNRCMYIVQDQFIKADINTSKDSIRTYNTGVRGRRLSWDDVPNLVGIAIHTFPNLDLVSWRYIAIGEIETFVVVSPVDGCGGGIGNRGECVLLIRVTGKAGKDLHFDAVRCRTIGYIEALVTKDSDRSVNDCPCLRI